MLVPYRLNRRRLLAGTALAAGAAPLLAGCDAGASSSGGGTVTLTVMYNNNELTKAHIADFEKKHKGIKIEFIQYDATRLNAMLASNNPPDFVRGAAVGSANTNARGLAENLDPYLAKSSVLKKSDLLAVNDSFRWDGTTIGKGPYYGICKDWSQDATLWYNTALFDSAGVGHLDDTDAITYDELLNIAKKLTTKKSGKTTVYGLGLEWAWNLYAPIAMMIAQQGGSLYDSGNAQTDLTTAAARKAIEWYVEFGQSAVGPSSLNPLPDGSDQSTFMAKRMAITQDGYWFGGNFISSAGSLQSSIRMAPAPVMGDQRISPTYAGIGAWIPAKSAHKDEAWKLMEYFMAGPPALERAQSGWGLPALTSLLSKLPQKAAYQKQAYAVAQNELQYAGPLPDSPYVTVDNWNTVLDKYLQKAIKKQISVDSACQQITDDVNKLLAQGKDQIG